MTKLGIFGGTFNPIHNGHLQIATMVLEETDLDEIIFIPSANPPHKTHEHIIPFEHRRNMLYLAISGYPRFFIQDIEYRLGGISYTVQTLDVLRQENPEAEFFLIIGSDSLLGLSTWKEPEKVVTQARFIVFPRAQADPALAEKRFLDNAILLKAPLIPISSSNIRSRVAHGKSIADRVPEKVARYITKNKLYLLN